MRVSECTSEIKCSGIHNKCGEIFECHTVLAARLSVYLQQSRQLLSGVKGLEFFLQIELFCNADLMGVVKRVFVSIYCQYRTTYEPGGGCVA